MILSERKTLVGRMSHDHWALIVSGTMLILLLGLSVYHRVGGYGVETDFYWAYAPDAERILHGASPHEPGVGPAYPLALILANTFFADWFVSGKVVSIVSSVICGMLVYKIIRRLFDPRIGFATMLLWYVTVLPWTIVASTDMFFACVVTTGIYFFLRNSQPSAADLVFSGLWMGIAMLTRPNAIVLPLGAMFILFLMTADQQDLASRARVFLKFCIPFVSILSPWYVIKNLFADPVVSDSHLVIASNFYGKPGVVSSEDMRLAAGKFDSLWAVVTYDFGHFLKHYVSNMYRHFYDFLVRSLKFPSFLFVAAGGMVLAKAMNRRQAYFFVFPVLSFLLLCLVHYEPRYYLYIVSFALCLVPYFFYEGLANHGSSDTIRHNEYLPRAAYAVTLALILLSSVKEIRANIASEPRELLRMTTELQGILEDDAAIIARKPHFGFLSNLQTVYFPQVKSIPALLEFAAKTKAEYLLYGEMEADRRPELQVLLNPEKLPPQFKPIYVLDNPRTIVYRILSDRPVNELYK